VPKIRSRLAQDAAEVELGARTGEQAHEHDPADTGTVRMSSST